jgi:hypothetical protein
MNPIIGKILSEKGKYPYWPPIKLEIGQTPMFINIKVGHEG